jgi:Flp pilus assembly protein TadG
VLFALSLTTLAGFFTFAIMLGNLVHSAATVQSAADALALWGAEEGAQSNWGAVDVQEPTGVAADILATNGVVGPWSLEPDCQVPPVPALVPLTAGLGAGGAEVCTAATSGCALGTGTCVVWAVVLEPQPSKLLGGTVHRSAMAYSRTGGRAELCDPATCPGLGPG